MKLMEGWLEVERQGTLNTEPPPTPRYPKVEGDVTAVEVAPTEALEQPPPIDAEEEAVASNLPSTAEEPANEVTSGYIGSHMPVNLKEEEEPATTVNNDPPST